MSARGYALRLLKTRLRSAWEIRQALLRREVEREEIETLINELTEIGLIDDLRYAKAWIATRDRLSPRGDSAIRRELQAKGIQREIIAQAFVVRQKDRDEEGEMSDEQRAVKLVQQRQRMYAHLNPEVAKRRMIAFLLRRGFAIDLVMRILKV